MRARRYLCAYPGCRGMARRAGAFCSRSCGRRWVLLFKTSAADRRAQMRHAIRMKFQRDIARMLQRVKVLADTEDERLVLAWRYGKGAAKAQRYREKQKGQAA